MQTKLKSVRGITSVVFAMITLVPAIAWAQNGAIAGVIHDTTGAVLPGVTVEATSPALIEKVRTAVSDNEGQYKVLDLRPGVYAVTFTLPGFRTVRREGLELAAGVTLNVPGELAVGAVEETLTVTGETPVVDVQNVTQHRVMTRDVIESVPTGRSMIGLSALVPGVIASWDTGGGSTDVGGNTGNRANLMSIHGSRASEMPQFLDGMRYNNIAREGAGNANNWQVDPGLVEQVVIDTGGHNAEAMTSGVRVNVIPKDGGNTFRGSFFGTFTNKSLEAINVTPAQEAGGVARIPSIEKLMDLDPAVGGPIRRDALWFFTSYRYGKAYNAIPGGYYAKDPFAAVYVPDTSRPAIKDDTYHSENLRLTWQLSPRNKISFLGSSGLTCFCHYTVSATNTPEASGYVRWDPADLVQVTYNSPRNNKFLVEAGGTIFNGALLNGLQPGLNTSILAVRDLGTGITSRAAANPYYQNWLNVNTKGRLSYVTGSHAFSVGVQTMHGSREQTTTANQDMSLQLRNGVPVQVQVYTTPYYIHDRLNVELGAYAQDQWTFKRTTLNLGIRFDYLNVFLPAKRNDAGTFVPARDYPEIDGLPIWKDVSPRLGIAYDLFGDGRTALKASVNKYLEMNITSLADKVDPVNSTINNTTRSWNDANGDFIPQPSELGPLANPQFGKLNVVTTFDPAYLSGWGKRGSNWEALVGVQHELTPHLSVLVEYSRHWYTNFLVNDNLLVAPTDYSPFCVTAPADSRLPGGGGNQICGFYDLNPDKVGQVQNYVTFADKYGKVSDVYNGIDVTMSLRLAHGANVQGGFNTGREVVDNCGVAGKTDQTPNLVGAIGSVGSPVNPGAVASPSTLYCHVAPPYQTQVKFLGTVPLPWWGLTASATLQSNPGPQILATYSATNAQVAPSLGRNLSGGATVTTVQLISPGTLYADRWNQLDFRMAKTFLVGRSRIQALVDLYNLPNASPLLGLNNTYGVNWLKPTQLMPGRFLKLGVQANF